MKLILHAILITSLGWVGCSQKEEKPADTNQTSSSSGNPLTAPVDYLGAVGRAQKSANKVASTVGIQQAIQMFHTQEGRYPKDLNELVGGDYLPKLPTPPAGMKYDYNASTGQVRVVPQ